MAEKNETGWVFDALVEFLQGSFWSSSILNFIEEKSLIFEPETSDSKEYREIHQEYKHFVNLLLDFYMEDMEITPEQFEQACSLIKTTGVAIKFDQNLFEQIWAANEFEVFKRMMIQKNLELQLQSLKLIEEKFGLTPASLTHETNEISTDDKLGKEPLETRKSNTTDEETLINVNLQVKRVEESVPQLNQAQCEAENKPKNNEKILINLQDSFHSEGDEQRIIVNAREILAELSNHEQSEEKDAATVGTSSINNSFADMPLRFHEEFNINSKETREEDIHNRQLYLKSQRDKLVALKKKKSDDKSKMNPARPNSACVVAAATIDSKQYDLVERQQVMDESILQVRKALAAKLKAEVVQK